MKWDDIGILLATQKINEKSFVITILTENHGLHKGCVNATKKDRCVLQIGNIVHVIWKARLAIHLGTFYVELLESVPAFFLYDYRKMLALSAITKTLTKILPEREKHQAIYKQTYELLSNLKSNLSWMVTYIKLELAILKELGFGLDLSKCPVSNSADNLSFVSPKTGRAISYDVGVAYQDKLLPLPQILYDIGNNKGNDSDCEKDFLRCLDVINYFLYKHCFYSYKIQIPIERELLYKICK